MVQIKDTRLLNQGMDKDSDERFMPQGKYRDAHNMRILTMTDDEHAEIGKLRSMDGWADIHDTSVIDISDKQIGAFEDVETGFVYVFLAGQTAANNKIIEFHPQDILTTPWVLIVQSEFLNFSINWPVNDAYKFDDILVFNDAYNQPRKVNVTRSYAGLDANEFAQAVNIIQRPPLYAPTISVSSDSNFGGNNIQDKFFQFKYRYIYADNAKSVFSPISVPAFSDLDQFHPKIINTVSGRLNMVSITMLIDHADVEDTGTDQFPVKVELAVREGNNGDFFSVDEIDYVSGESINASFYNDGTYTPISLAEANQLMDDVPHKAGAQTVSEGRIIWGDVTRGYDDSTVMDVLPNVILRDQPTSATATGTMLRARLSNYTLFATDIAAAPWSWVYGAGDKFTVTGLAGTDFPYGSVTIQSVAGETLLDVYTRIITAIADTIEGQDLKLIEPPYQASVKLYYNDSFTIDIESGADNTFGFKSGEWYRSGLVYEDDEGRQQGVYSDSSMRFYVPTIPEREGITAAAKTNAGLCAVGFMINHAAPSWATRYKLAITPERVTPKSIMLAVNAATVVSGNLTQLELYTPGIYASTYDSTNVVYSFEKGDRVRILAIGDGVASPATDIGNWYQVVHDFEILKSEVGPPVTIEAHMPGVTVAELDGALIEIYSPSASIDADEGIWFEIPGSSYPIVDGDHHGVVNQISVTQASSGAVTCDALIDETTYARVRFAYDSIPSDQLPAIGVGTVVISGLAGGDADWNATYDVTGYDIQESFVDVLIVTAVMPSGDATPVASCLTYDYDDAPAILTVSAFNAYGRMREMHMGAAGATPTDYYIESQYMNDFTVNSKTSFISRPAAILNVKGEKRDKATVIYTEPYIFNTEINGTGKVYPDINFEEYNHKFGPISKLHTRDDGIIMLQARKTSKILINKAMIYSADGGGSLTTSANLLSKQIPFVGDYGCINPESFTSYGARQWFADAINGTVMMLEGDRLTEVSKEGMMRWWRDKLVITRTGNIITPGQYQVIGAYDPVFEEYVVSVRDITGTLDTYTLAFSTLSNGWISFYDYDPYRFMISNNILWVLSERHSYFSFPDLPGYIFGAYKNSTVNIVSNTDPDTMKNYFALEIDSIKAPVTVDVETEGGQEANMFEADFEELEGIFLSPIFCDANTPNVSNPTFEGDTIKAKTALIKLVFENAAGDGCEIATVSAIVSRA